MQKMQKDAKKCKNMQKSAKTCKKVQKNAKSAKNRMQHNAKKLQQHAKKCNKTQKIQKECKNNANIHDTNANKDKHMQEHTTCIKCVSLNSIIMIFFIVASVSRHERTLAPATLDHSIVHHHYSFLTSLASQLKKYSAMIQVKRFQ